MLGERLSALGGSVGREAVRAWGGASGEGLSARGVLGEGLSAQGGVLGVRLSTLGGGALC